jgi:acyl-CoA thioester hydrolase
MSSEKYRVAVRFSDLDALGHVNYAVYLSYLEDALDQLWLKVVGTLGLGYDPKSLGIVSVRAEIDYRAPAFCHQILEVQVWVSAIGNSSFTASYQVFDVDSSRLLIDAKTVQVVTIPGEQKKRMPEGIRAALESYSGR